MTARIAKVLPGFVKHDRATFVPASATLLRAMLKSVVKMTALWGEELKTRDLHASIPFHSAIIEDLGHDFGGCLMWSRTTRSAGRDFFEFLNHQKRRGELFRVFHFGRKGSLALDQAEALDTKHKIEIVAEGDSGRLLSKLTAKEKRVEFGFASKHEFRVISRMGHFSKATQRKQEKNRKKKQKEKN